MRRRQKLWDYHPQSEKKIKYAGNEGYLYGYDNEEGEIIGVVKDYHNNSLHLPIQPIILKLSAEGSFSDAAEKMETLALSLENGSYRGVVILSSVGLGILLFLAGLYQISTGVMIRKLVKKQSSK